MKCGRPGCDGTLEDMGGGALYCGSCGHAPAPGGYGGPGVPGVPPGASVPSARSAAGTGGRMSSRTASSGSSRSSTSHRSVSGRLSRAEAALTGSRSVSVRSSRSSGSAGRANLGAGLVTVPPVPRADPRAAVLDNPEVPERKRWCSRSECGAAVGRSRGDRPGRTEGYCTACGHPYSFTPKLRAGDIVHGQYEVAGCLAHGGLGWIYLAVDRAVSDRWVVLKGLLDTGDEDALQAALSERRFLAEIEHANIVRIYNFVEHLDPRTSTFDGYIVMEYVGGKSLKDIANDRRDERGHRVPLPVEQAIAYGIEALEALGHLHSRGLLYCDFKVDNALQQDNSLKLIDLGAVRRMDDVESAIYGTVGYQAPEVAEIGPSVASDLYTVARTLAVLTFDFQGYTNVFADSLPDPRNIEVFQRYESFYRLLVRATDPDPDRRFSSAQEMADQLTGVLREVVSLQSGRPRPALSTLFGPELRVVDTELVAPFAGDFSRLGAVPRSGAPVPARAAAPGRATGTLAGVSSPVPPGVVAELDPAACALALPVPLVDPEDPNAGFLAGLVAAAPAEVLAALAQAPAQSLERRLRELRARLELGDLAQATIALVQLANDRGGDWRVVWYQGLAALVQRDFATAATAFDAVYDAFPGETAPKVALAVCAEVLGQLDNAADYYGLVWATDQTWVSAAFGLARVRLAAGDRVGAVRALESVPESSIHFTAACVASVRARLRSRAPQEPLLADLAAAADRAERLDRLGIDAVRRETLRAEVLGCALDWVLAGGSGGPAGSAPRTVLLGSAVEERELRFGLERSYRVLARLAHRGEDRINLVDSANRFRPRTWV
ncbi:serine/threonine-protein kinase [Streptantibioticus silvisoli]|uniref:non-specific serine/threonine protein kinase n=1 Tax=Streptantibioticus silvisoli TaxID=2705255 RepID=A0ABT6WAJ8_9ACTN|nr:serine/threonine-protein kinase [Streptantibioticus silvisoli]MDI5967281.1 tetratricopeptide repeat protein [Streptantibioticus silvisoli]